MADVYTVYKLYIPLDSVVIFATNDDNPEETNSYDRLHNTVGNFTPGTTIVTDAWRGYQTVAQLSNGVYDHAVIVHAHEFIDSVDRDIHTETIEGMWKQEWHNSLFASYLAAFQWHNIHKQNVFGCYLQMLCANYNI